MHYFTFQQHVVAVNVAPAECGPSWPLSLRGTGEAWGPSVRRVMESFQAYLFKTSAYLNAAQGFREFGFLVPDSHSSEMHCSWDHAHAPSVLSYLLLTPNRAGSQSVSRGWREGSFIFWPSLNGQMGGACTTGVIVTKCGAQGSFLLQSKHFAIILLMIHTPRPEDGWGQDPDVWKGCIYGHACWNRKCSVRAAA